MGMGQGMLNLRMYVKSEGQKIGAGALRFRKEEDG